MEKSITRTLIIIPSILLCVGLGLLMKGEVAFGIFNIVINATSILIGLTPFKKE